MTTPSPGAGRAAPAPRTIALAILVAALGYFVDIYDLILFSIVRVASLRSLGVPDERLLAEGVLLLNMQMGGMLVGGIIWGVLGDKRGRLSVLFGSIVMYSLANIANGFVTTVPQYAVLRFVAGVGLAGELGPGITLVSEIMPVHTRGYGTMIVATVGILGAVAASLVGDAFDWRIAYFVGGGMGIALLVLRIGVAESGLFEGIRRAGVARGQLRVAHLVAENAPEVLARHPDRRAYLVRRRDSGHVLTGVRRRDGDACAAQSRPGGPFCLRRSRHRRLHERGAQSGHAGAATASSRSF